MLRLHGLCSKRASAAPAHRARRPALTEETRSSRKAPGSDISPVIEGIDPELAVTAQEPELHERRLSGAVRVDGASEAECAGV